MSVLLFLHVDLTTDEKGDSMNEKFNDQKCNLLPLGIEGWFLYSLLLHSKVFFLSFQVRYVDAVLMNYLIQHLCTFSCIQYTYA